MRKRSAKTTRRPTHNAKKRKIKEERLILPTDIFSIVFPYLEAHAMINLASTNQDIMRLVTHDLVIRNTLLAKECKASRRIDHVLYRLKFKSGIYLPSPMRLLRIAHGRQCEFHGCLRSVSRLTAGLLLCPECAAQKTTAYPLRRNSFLKQFRNVFSGSDFSLFHDRLLTTRPFRSIDRQRQGTLLSKVEVDRLVRDDITAEEYFDDNDTSIVDNDFVERLIQVAVEADDERITRIRELRKRKPDGIIAIESAIASVKADLRGVAKDFALDYEAKNYEGKWKIQMTYPLSSSILRGLVRHERYITKKRVLALPREIDDAYADIAASGIVDFNCFSNDTENHPLQAGIRQCLEQTLEPGESILRNHMLCPDVLALIRNGHIKSAMLQFAFGRSHGQIPWTLTSIMVRLIVLNGTIIDNPTQSRIFARRISDICAEADRENLGTWSHIENVYTLAGRCYKRLSPLIQEYQEDATTAAFCAWTAPTEWTTNLQRLIRAWEGHKRRAVRSMWDQLVEYPRVQDLLLNKDWRGMREYHYEVAIRKMRSDYKSPFPVELLAAMKH